MDRQHNGQKQNRTQGQTMIYTEWLGVRVMGCNGSFNNISAILSRSVLLVRDTGVPGENYRPTASHFIT